MKAWRIYDKGIIKCEEMESRPPLEGMIKIKMSYSAISLTDVMLFDGRYHLKSAPQTIGRQGVGMVTEVGENAKGFQRGNRVVVDPYRPCKTCYSCKNSKPSECEKLTTCGVDADGFMSDFLIVDANYAYVLPDQVKETDAVFLEHIAMSMNALNKLNIEKGSHVVIVGANVLGIIMAQVALYYQAVPVLVDTRQDRLDLAESMGIYYTINSVEADPLKKILSITGGKMAEAVAYITTSKMSLVHSFDYATKNGKVAIVGWADNRGDLNANLASVYKNQLSVMGINNAARLFPSAINMLVNKTVDVSRLSSKEIDFDSVPLLLEEQSNIPNRYLKVLVKL